LSEPLTMLWHGDTGLLVRVAYEGEDDLILFAVSQVSAVNLRTTSGRTDRRFWE
jgi:hypothetical protein